MQVINLFKKLTIQTFDDKATKSVPPRVLMYDEEKCKAENEKGSGIFWTINQQEVDNHRSITNTSSFQVVGLDCDVTKETDEKKGNVRLSEEEVKKAKEELLLRLDGLPVKPSGVIETRNGLQPYWVFKTPFVLDNVERRKKANIRYQMIVKGFAQTTGIKSEGDNIQRVLRMPGFYHKKSEEDFLVKEIYEEGVECEYEDFRKAYPPYEEPKASSSVLSANKLEDIPVEEALTTLSGNPAVNGEIYTFHPNSNGTVQIFVNGKSTSQWIDTAKNTIGGGGEGQGNPTIIQWVAWYFKSKGENNTKAHASAYSVLNDLFPQVAQREKDYRKKFPELKIEELDHSKIARKIADPNYSKGLMTGFTILDNLIGGLKRELTYGIIAISGQGKSLFAVNMLCNIARQGYGVLYFDFENGERMGETRLLKIAYEWSQEEIDAMSVEQIENAFIQLDETLPFYRLYNIGDLEYKERQHIRVMRIIEKYVKEKDIRVVVLDNINCFIPDNRLNDNQYKNEIYVAFNQLAIDLKISLIEIHHATDKIDKKMGLTEEDIEKGKKKEFILPFLSKALGTSVFNEKISVGISLAMWDRIVGQERISLSVQKDRENGGSGVVLLNFDAKTLRISDSYSNSFPKLTYQKPLEMSDTYIGPDEDMDDDDTDINPFKGSVDVVTTPPKQDKKKIIVNISDEEINEHVTQVDEQSNFNDLL